VKFAETVRESDGPADEPDDGVKEEQPPSSFLSIPSTMGRPADSNTTTDESLTVRDNRTGKTYNVPYVSLRWKVGGQTKTKV
jgi:hypothetical protein